MLRATVLSALLRLSLGGMTQVRIENDNTAIADQYCDGYDVVRQDDYEFDEMHFVADAGSYASYSTTADYSAPGYCGASLDTCDGYTDTADADGLLTLSWDRDLSELSASVRVCNTAGSTVNVNCVCSVSPLSVGPRA